MHAEPSPFRSVREDDAIAQVAAAWIARRDRGLTSAEARELAAWRSADSRHAAEWARLEASWQHFDLAKEAPELVDLAQQLDEATRSRPVASRWWKWTLGAAAAAAIVLALAYRPREALESAPAVAAPAYEVVPSLARERVLSDGSRVELRGESEVAEAFSERERRVLLVRGEAHFHVMANPDRPFVVQAGPIAVRAVGTAFNVRLDNDTVEVLVTHGQVRVQETAASDPTPATAPWAETPLLSAGQRATIGTAPIAREPIKVEVNAVAPHEIEQTLAWQKTRLVFNRTSLSEAVEAFNLHSSHRLVLGDTSLRDRLLGGIFRTDNIEGFVRLLEQTADVRAEYRGPEEIVLWPVPEPAASR